MIKKELLAIEEDMTQVLGGILLNADLLYDSNYPIDPQDFIGKYAVVYTAVHNLARRGMREFSDDIVFEYIDKHIQAYRDLYLEHQPNNDLVKECQEQAKTFNFAYHYQKLRKMSYLRDLNVTGFDISKFYDIDGADLELNARFDKMTLDDIRTESQLIRNKMEERWTRVLSDNESATSKDLTEEKINAILNQKMKLGHKFPMGLEVLTHIFRGQIPEVYALNVASSGVGKSRIAMLQAVNNACEFMWDDTEKDWIYIGKSAPTLYISTEMKLDSLFSMALAFVSGVNESKIKRNKCSEKEKKRIQKAGRIIREGGLYFEFMPTFTIESIESTVEEHVLTNKVELVYFDYIHASTSVMTSMANKTGMRNLSTDKILEAFSIELKNSALRYGTYLATSSQVNRGSQGDDGLSFGSIRGAYSLPDKFDTVIFSTIPNKKQKKRFMDLNLYESSDVTKTEPNFCITILKNRDGEDNDVTLWFYLNRGNMRFEFINVTDKEITEGYDLKIDRYAFEREETPEDSELYQYLISA